MVCVHCLVELNDGYLDQNEVKLDEVLDPRIARGTDIRRDQLEAHALLLAAAERLAYGVEPLGGQRKALAAVTWPAIAEKVLRQLGRLSPSCPSPSDGVSTSPAVLALLAHRHLSARFVQPAVTPGAGPAFDGEPGARLQRARRRRV